jgi:hypothetical protein
MAGYKANDGRIIDCSNEHAREFCALAPAWDPILSVLPINRELKRDYASRLRGWMALSSVTPFYVDNLTQDFPMKCRVNQRPIWR